ncbi:MAG: hypothetical protein K6F95_11445 [Selenomonas sp.]|uniref:hypothetical protein n=1 Tax=Selenomonas sp. TaxID=2053611 RepID=UPI0025DDB6A0|nr:hypothetical protein [Selenomonas sp.]MCR5758504.1 hypothetical protein [Selenomonas sp.]
MTIYAFYRLAYLVSKGNKDTAFVLASFVGIFVCIFFIRTRPQIFSSLIFIVEIMGLELLCRTKNRKYICLFPVLSLLLINLHAAMWPMMLIFLLPYLLDHLIRYDQKRWFTVDDKIGVSSLGMIALFIVVSGLLNPYGWEAMTYVFRSYGYDLISNYISEMHPITIRDGAGKICEVLFFGVIVVYARHRIAIRHLAFTLGTMVLALSSFRSLYLFLVIGLYPLAYVYRDWQGWKEPKPQTDNLRLRKILMLLIIIAFLWILINKYAFIWRIIESQGIVLFSAVMFLVMLFVAIDSRYGRLHFVKNKVLRWAYIGVIFIICFEGLVAIAYKHMNGDRLPDSVLAIDYLLAHERKEDVRLWTNYNEGGYPEFKGLRCFIDPRAEVFLISNNKQRDVLYEYLSVERGYTDYRTFLSWYDFNYILVGEDDIMYTYLPRDGHYELVLDYRTEDGGKFCLYHKKG